MKSFFWFIICFIIIICLCCWWGGCWDMETEGELGPTGVPVEEGALPAGTETTLPDGQPAVVE